MDISLNVSEMEINQERSNLCVMLPFLFINFLDDNKFFEQESININIRCRIPFQNLCSDCSMWIYFNAIRICRGYFQWSINKEEIHFMITYNLFLDILIIIIAYPFLFFFIIIRTGSPLSLLQIWIRRISLALTQRNRTEQNQFHDYTRACIIPRLCNLYKRRERKKERFDECVVCS